MRKNMVLKIPRVSVSTVFVIIPILYFNSCTFEFIKHLSFILPLVVASILLWLLFLAKEGVAVNTRSMLPMVGYALVLCVLFLAGAGNRVSVLATDFANTLYLLFFMCVFAIYSDEQYKKERILIVSVCITDTVVSCIYSIYRLIDEPNLSRLLSTGSYHTTDEAIRARGVVSFGVVYGLVLILLALFFLITKEKKNRGIHIFLFLLFVTALFLAQFLLAILSVCIGIALMFFVNYTDKKNKQIRFLYLIIIAVVCMLCLPALLKVIANSDIFGYEINARLKELSMLFERESLEETDLSVRLFQYLVSLSAFISSYGMGKIVNHSVTVGSHSQWLDGFGNYGLLFVLYIFALFVFRNFVIQRLKNEKAKQLYRMVFVIYSIMSLTNTSMWAPITLSLCVIVPFLCLDKVSE